LEKNYVKTLKGRFSKACTRTRRTAYITIGWTLRAPPQKLGKKKISPRSNLFWSCQDRIRAQTERLRFPKDLSVFQNKTQKAL
jgi:hypothetical protein